MDLMDLAARWTTLLPAYLRIWGQGAPALEAHEVAYYTCWLAHHGRITPAEKAWLLADIQRARTARAANDDA